MKPPPDRLCACLHCGQVFVADFLIPHDRKEEKKPPAEDGGIFWGMACPTCNKSELMKTSEYRTLYT